MSSAVADQGNRNAGAPRARPRSWLAALYPAVWRWHFWAGLIVTPFLIVVSLTGALYVFQEDLRRASARDLNFVAVPPEATPKTYGERVAAARAYVNDPAWEFSSFYEAPEPARSNQVVFERQIGPPENHEHEHRTVYVNPYNGAVLGEQSFKKSVFYTILQLHRNLLVGTPGSLLVELSTCWGIVSMITGLLLWWPRGKEKLWGVWLPRLRKGGKLALRDLHTIPGLYLFAVVIAIMVTGLLYTRVWGQAAYAGLYFGGQLPAAYLSPPKSTPLADAALPVTIDQVIVQARAHYPFREASISAPHTPGDAWVVQSPTYRGNLTEGAVYIDASTGATLATIDYPSLAPGAKVALLFYSIHTGLIFGLPTKILAVIACLVIVTMSITGIWMWWRRRPAGKFGAPRKTQTELVPRAAMVAIIVLAVLFPLVGLSLVTLWLGELVFRRFRKSSVPA